MRRNGIAVIVFSSMALLFAANRCQAEGPLETQVQTALDDLHRWIGPGEKGERWQKYLKSDVLTAELAKGQAADPQVIETVLNQYRGTAAGLEMRRFVAVREALLAWQAELARPQPQELAQAARDAAANFQPIDPQAVGQAKAELVSAVSDLEQFLNRSGTANATRWKTFLNWNDLVAIVSSAEGPPPEVIGALRDQYTANERGLELPAFTRVRIALDRYASTSAAAADEKLQEQYAQQLEALAAQLEAYAQDPTAGDAALAIGRGLDWLERNRQASELVSAVRSAYGQSNFYGYASQRLAAAGIEDDVNEIRPVRDNILGTSLHGTAHMVGRTRLVLNENPRAASFNVLLGGTARSNNVGYNGGVTIFTTGVTQVAGSKYLQMTANGMSAAPAIASCQTRSSINGINAKSGLVERIAWKRASGSKSQAEAIASDHAEVRVASQMNERSAKLVAEQNDRYFNKFRNPLVRRGHFPQDLSFSSRKDRAEVRMLQAGAARLASPVGPPEVEATHDLAVRAHESSVINFGEGVIGGYYLTDLRLEKHLKEDLKTDVPEELQVTLPDGTLNQDKEPWALQFSREFPVRAKFMGGKLWIAIRSDAFFRGQDDPTAEYNKALEELIEISADYTIERTDAGATLRRQGDVVVSFPNAKPGERSLARTGASAFLKVKFRNLFKEEFVGEGLTFKGRWARAGKLKLQEIASDNAWLTVGWKLPPPGTPIETLPPPAAATPAPATGG